jgi:predicted nucleic acid-binding protein
MAATPLVLDTSVILKWFRQGEILAEQALALREGYLEGRFDLVIPTLCAYELANALRYKKDLTATLIQQALESFFDMGFELIPPMKAMLAKAIEIAYRYRTSIYDAIFVALADLSAAQFITADQKLADQLVDLAFVRYLGNVELSMNSHEL